MYVGCGEGYVQKFKYSTYLFMFLFSEPGSPVPKLSLNPVSVLSITAPITGGHSANPPPQKISCISAGAVVSGVHYFTQAGTQRILILQPKGS